MRVESHLDKVTRLDEARGRLNPLEDFGLWYWATLTVSTNAYNAYCHLADLTVAEQAFATTPRLYVVPAPDGSFTREVRELGDVSHVGWPTLDVDPPEDIRRLEEAIHVIEEYRDPCLRGERDPDPDVVRICGAAYDAVLHLLSERTKGAPS